MNQAQSINPSFRGQVLKQIYRVWLFRRLLPVLVLEIVVLSILFFQLSKVVFIQRVIENGLNVLFLDPPQIIAFIVDMFVSASWLTKVLGFAIIAFIALIVRHITQGMLRLFLVRQNYFAKK